MTRPTMPKAMRDAVLNEYNHRCAVCGADRPQTHHIDEDASNNDLLNLIPLCPNCHLVDQHNPTRKIEIPKLQLFRRHKDPAILKPQFHAIYLRQLFLDFVVDSHEDASEFERQADHLIEFVRALEMGTFYAKRLEEALGGEPGFFALGEPDLEYEERMREGSRRYRRKLIANREVARGLLIEMLRFQPWANT